MTGHGARRVLPLALLTLTAGRLCLCGLSGDSPRPDRLYRCGASTWSAGQWPLRCPVRFWHGQMTSGTGHE